MFCSCVLLIFVHHIIFGMGMMPKHALDVGTTNMLPITSYASSVTDFMLCFYKISAGSKEKSLGNSAASSEDGCILHCNARGAFDAHICRCGSLQIPEECKYLLIRSRLVPNFSHFSVYPKCHEIFFELTRERLMQHSVPIKLVGSFTFVCSILFR